jgi:2-oxoglutarate dehydrogenase E1 component
VWHDQVTGEAYTPLDHVNARNNGEARFRVFDSPLSETAVLGYDYGYSLEWPDALVIWEAQFGDFANGAQVIIDQFLTSSEDKWARLSGLVLLLPHGFEGQGPEHSSARLERFLTLAAEDNIQVMNLTTPAQLFHAMRRQQLASIRKPLVIMTPKSLLRSPQAVSTLDELADGAFQCVIADEAVDAAAVRRVLLCTGKVYYDLIGEREARSAMDHAIVRVEQLYPLATDELAAVLERYPNATSARWVQEEPVNMGAWVFMRFRFGGKLFGRLPFTRVSRPESASPATGSKASHDIEQHHLLTQAFDDHVIHCVH